MGKCVIGFVVGSRENVMQSRIVRKRDNWIGARKRVGSWENVIFPLVGEEDSDPGKEECNEEKKRR